MFSAQIEGGDKLAKTLANLEAGEKREFRAAARKGLRKAMAGLLADARAAAPVKTGRLKKAIKIKAWKRPAPGELGVKLIIDPGVSRADTKGAYYGMIVENGYIHGGTYIPGRYMLTNAYNRRGQAAGDQAAQAISTAVDEAIRK